VVDKHTGPHPLRDQVVDYLKMAALIAHYLF
jgi:hypothetical protein